MNGAILTQFPLTADPYTNLADMREADFNHYTDRNGSIGTLYYALI